MIRALIEQHLALAERHVADGYARITRQHQICAELSRDGYVKIATQARELLGQFERVQALFVADRDRLVKELAELTD